ncbi:MAG: hypothetical protein AAF725_12040 [Acidobacteriota bacterium]
MHVIGGNHTTLLTEPHVRDLAAQLTTSLRQARERVSDAPPTF